MNLQFLLLLYLVVYYANACEDNGKAKLIDKVSTITSNFLSVGNSKISIKSISIGKIWLFQSLRFSIEQIRASQYEKSVDNIF